MKQTFNPCDECSYNFSKNNQESKMCKICEFKKLFEKHKPDDCCILETDYLFYSDKYKRETSCGYTYYDLHHHVPFKYCPYCGKKIKAVEV